MHITVFVTYCWENDDHDNKVLSFTNHLRKVGFLAEMDKLKSQEETAVDFVKMMNVAMTSYDKVIVVLSENYKSRAEMFKGGVGMEYNLIIKDIDTNPKKYILVSFQGISNEIIPLSLKGREIVDLEKGEGEFKKLYSKLMGKDPIKFADIGKTLPTIDQTEIPDLLITKETKGVEFEKIDEYFMNDSLQGGQYKYCHRRIKILLRNKSGRTIDGCEIDLDINSTFLYGGFYGDGPENILKTTIEKKIYANQTLETTPIQIKVSDFNSVEAGRSSIKGKIYSEVGETTFEIPLLDCITVSPNFQKRRIELDDFLKPF